MGTDTPTENKQPAAPLPHPFRFSAEAHTGMVTLPVEAKDCAACQAVVDRHLSALDRQSIHDSRIAQSLQQSILPASIPQVDSLDLAVAYKAAADEALIGGDFYDVFALDQDRAAIVIGDVCGKGLQAAAQIATIRNMTRYALYTQKGLSRALTELNHVLAGHKLLSEFVTLFVGILTSKTRRFEYASCGHQPGLIVRRNAKLHVELLMPTGPVLGLTSATNIKSSTRRLNPGDSFVLFTDGLVECGPYKSELLSVARLIHMLRDRCVDIDAQQMASLIFSDAKAHAGLNFNDDVCLVVGQATTNSLPVREGTGAGQDSPIIGSRAVITAPISSKEGA